MRNADQKIKATAAIKRVRITRCKLTKKQQLRMIEFFVLGVTARSAADLMGMQPNTAALFYRKVREVIAHYLSQEAKDVFNGEFVLDESSFAKQDDNKLAVFGMMARDGKVFTKMSGQINAALLTSASPNMILPDSVVFADERNHDLTLDVNECHQECVSTSTLMDQEKYVIGETESFWNQTKHILRKYNGIPKNTFPLFLKECEFRFNYGTPKEQLNTLKIWTGLK